MSGRPITVRTYAGVLLALLLLTAATLLLSFAPLGAFHVPVALLIAAAKAALILLYFMHVIEQRYTIRIVLLVCALLLGSLIVLTVADTATRDVPFHAPSPE